MVKVCSSDVFHLFDQVMSNQVNKQPESVYESHQSINIGVNGDLAGNQIKNKEIKVLTKMFSE